jgi:hypothetical protein
MRALILSFVLSLPLAGCGGEASTPELCDEACRRWDACTGSDNWYPYDQCMTECERDGDWDRGYVDCLKEHSSCIAMEQNCG